MVTAGQLYSETRNRLKPHFPDSFTFEARCIAEHILNTEYSKLIANPDVSVPEEKMQLVETITDKRISGYPLQYILGEWEFFGLPFRVGEGVLIPRQDTETLVECVLDKIRNIKSPHIADLCSGSGCIPIAIEKYSKNAQISAVEYSDAALSFLRQNKELNNSGLNIFKGDVLSSDTCRLFSELDIITSNPPYLTPEDMNVLQKEVSFEPEMALAGGDDGLLFYRVITENWKTCLKPGGMIFYEIGIHQEDDVSEILRQNGFTCIECHRDLCGIIRVISGVYNS